MTVLSKIERMTDLEALRIVPLEPMDGLKDRVAPRRTRDATIAAKLGCSFGGSFVAQAGGG
ncbi:hypothetical protein [Phenylobacterium sp. RIFCSPHIGHO2_01_FULL_69_31]|uniref:hypothetical protein n=1 Tax=Phenylobacterium sp. RIFCSPHIGHO2_01_FULL_69_31 TaxID=1801944 RepID=UPI0025E5C0DF|nr:hypothetical protein [Phenylobacterium sp. RIFCSPHIGHO2_01_FULL_69_31]